MNKDCYNSYLEIDLSKIGKNYLSVKASLGDNVKIIPVLKGNAYGLGAVQVAKQLLQEDNIELFAVAQVREALELREAGINQDILILGAVPYQQIEYAVDAGLQLTVFNLETVQLIDSEAAKKDKCIDVHIKIESGLNRIGIRPGDDLQKLLDVLAGLSHVNLKGVFTHFIDAEIKDSKTAYKQLEIYNKAVKQIEDSGFEIPIKHVCNSGASEWMKDAYFDAVRLGRRLYMDSRDTPFDKGTCGAVEEIASWRTQIVNIHMVMPGETVGYDGIYMADKPVKVATVCVGYGDGLCRGFVEAKSKALINGQLATYLGICMDQCLLDVSNIDCKIGDEVTIFGYASDGSFLSSQSLAATVGNEGVYFTDILSNRVKRKYI